MLCEKCGNQTGFVHNCPTPDSYVGNWILAVIIAVVFISVLVWAPTVDAQETRVTQGVVCLNLDDAKAIVDIEVDKSLADAFVLASRFIQQRKCMVLRFSMPTHGNTNDMAYYRQKDSMALGVIIILSPNGTPLYAIIRGQEAPKDEGTPI